MKQELLQIKAALRAWLRRGDGEGRADHGMRLTVAAVVLLFPAACLLVDRSDSLSLLLLLAIGLTAWVRNGFRAGLTRREWAYVAVFAFFFVAGLLAFEFGHQTDAGFRLLGRYLRLLFVLPALMALKRHRPPAALVWAGLGLGAVALGADAAWERIAGGAGAGLLTANTDSNASILLGDLSLLTGFGLAAGYPYVRGRIPQLAPWLVGFGVFGGLLACFLSGTRGAWVALPVLLVLLLSCRHLLHPRTVVVGAAAVAVLFAGLYLLPQTHMRERLQAAVSQYQVYSQVRHSVHRIGKLPACMANGRLLQIWAGNVLRQPHKGLKALVRTERRKSRLSLRHYRCRQTSVLQLQNTSTKRIRVRLPRTIQPEPGSARICWIVSGRGFLGFGHGPTSVHRFKSEYYKAMELSTERRYGDGVTVVIPGHSEVKVVPMELFAGEYSYAALNHASVAERLSMWAAAWSMFRSAPLLGVGTGTYMSTAQAMVDADLAPPVVAVYDHPHDEYLDALSSRGLIGLLALLLFLGVPAWLFSRGLSSSDPVRLGACLAGLMLPVGFALFGLTETMFIHSVTLGWYAIMTAVFLVTADATEGRVQ